MKSTDVLYAEKYLSSRVPGIKAEDIMSLFKERPFYPGINSIPLQYREHRYLTKGEAARPSLPRELQGQETTRYAYRTFDRVFMLVDEHYQKFSPEVMETFLAVERALLAEQAIAEDIALNLLQAGRKDLAAHYLTGYVSTQALEGLRMAEIMAQALEVRTEALFGIRELPKPGK